MMPSTVTHITQNTRYRVVLERSATKGIIGYKVEANSDNLIEVIKDAEQLKAGAEKLAVEKEGE